MAPLSPAEYQFLLRGGVGSLTVQPLVATGMVLGMLIVADGQPSGHDPTVVAGVELLASLAAASLSNAALVENLTDRAVRDPLTGLRNSTELHNDLTDASVATIKSNEHRITCSLIDVDNFKAVNDQRGHHAGDVLLRELAQALAHQLRDSDALYRIGGDEFAALVNTADHTTASAIADRLVAAAAMASAPISLGWAVVDGPPVHVRTRADGALYAAKNAGRGTHRPADAPT